VKNAIASPRAVNAGAEAEGLLFRAFFIDLISSFRRSFTALSFGAEVAFLVCFLPLFLLDPDNLKNSRFIWMVFSCGALIYYYESNYINVLKVLAV
jgi:hypothetical protein